MKSPRLLLIGTFPHPRGGISVHLQRLKQAAEAAAMACSAIDESRLGKPDLPNLWAMSPLDYVRALIAADVVHIHTSHPFLRLAHVLMARLLLRKVVVTVHSLTAPRRSAAARLSYRLASRLAHVSVFVSEQVRAGLSGGGPVIPAFLPPAALEEGSPAGLASWIRKQQAEGRRAIVSNASRLTKYQAEDLYGLDMLIECFSSPEVRERFACLFLVSSLDGGEEYFAACSRRIVDAGISPQFLLVSEPIGFAGLLKLADVFIRATNTDGDALSVREALWYGKRVLGSDCASRPAGVTLFRSRNVADLRDKLLNPSVQANVSSGQDFARPLLELYRSLNKTELWR
jgi:hypothetical protein